MIYQSPPPQPKAEPQEQYSFLKAWGYQGSDEGQFNYPSGVAVDSSGNVYVSDLHNNQSKSFGYSQIYTRNNNNNAQWSASIYF